MTRATSISLRRHIAVLSWRRAFRAPAFFFASGRATLRIRLSSRLPRVGRSVRRTRAAAWFAQLWTDRKSGSGVVAEDRFVRHVFHGRTARMESQYSGGVVAPS